MLICSGHLTIDSIDGPSHPCTALPNRALRGGLALHVLVMSPASFNLEDLPWSSLAFHL